MSRKQVTKTGLDYRTAEAKAHKIYLGNKKLTQEEVAEMVGVTRSTINKWSQAGEWDEQRKLVEMTPAQIERMVKEEMRKLLSEETSEEEQRKAIAKADALAKMNTVLKTLSDPERKLLNAMDTFEEFGTWLAFRDLELSRTFTRLQLEFISEKTQLRKNEPA